MNSDGPVQTNLMDVLLFLLKAAVLQHGTERKMVLTKSCMMVEELDLKMVRQLDGSVKLELIRMTGPEAKIVVPNGQSPLTIID